MNATLIRNDELSLRYYGKAFDNHTISAKNLASSLLHFSDAVNAASKSIDPKFKVELQVTAQRAGSFDIVFLFEHALETIGEFSQTDKGKALEFINGFGIPSFIAGAIKLALHKISHGEPTITENTEQSNDVLFTDEHVTLTYPDGTKIETTRTQLKASESSDFINHIGEAFTPSVDDKYDGVEITTRKDNFSVSPKEANAMKNYIPKEDIINESDITLVVQPLNANFENNKKWKLTTGNGEIFTAEINDDTFYDEIENGLQIGKKDILKVQAHTISSRDRHGKLKTQYTITKVLEHIPYNPPIQGSLNI